MEIFYVDTYPAGTQQTHFCANTCNKQVHSSPRCDWLRLPVVPQLSSKPEFLSVCKLQGLQQQQFQSNDLGFGQATAMVRSVWFRSSVWNSFVIRGGRFAYTGKVRHRRSLLKGSFQLGKRLSRTAEENNGMFAASAITQFVSWPNSK